MRDAGRGRARAVGDRRGDDVARRGDADDVRRAGDGDRQATGRGLGSRTHEDHAAGRPDQGDEQHTETANSSQRLSYCRLSAGWIQSTVRGSSVRAPQTAASAPSEALRASLYDVTARKQARRRTYAIRDTASLQARARRQRQRFEPERPPGGERTLRRALPAGELQLQPFRSEGRPSPCGRELVPRQLQPARTGRRLSPEEPARWRALQLQPDLAGATEPSAHRRTSQLQPDRVRARMFSGARRRPRTRARDCVTGSLARAGAGRTRT